MEKSLEGPLPKLCSAVVLSHQDGRHSAVALLLKAALIQVSDYRLLGASGSCLVNKISCDFNLFKEITCLIRPLFLCANGDLLIQVLLDFYLYMKSFIFVSDIFVKVTFIYFYKVLE